MAIGVVLLAGTIAFPVATAGYWFWGLSLSNSILLYLLVGWSVFAAWLLSHIVQSGWDGLQQRRSAKQKSRR